MSYLPLKPVSLGVRKNYWLLFPFSGRGFPGFVCEFDKFILAHQNCVVYIIKDGGWKMFTRQGGVLGLGYRLTSQFNLHNLFTYSDIYRLIDDFPKIT